MIFIWFLLFGIVLEEFLVKYGFPSLLLYPEYLEQVNFKSHFILGFACGGFIMAYNITSYIMNGFRFPFIATLANPFLKYCINNFIIPLSFVGIYIYKLINYQLYKEFEPTENVAINVVGFGLGILVFLIIGSTYFLKTNKDLFKIFGVKIGQKGAANPVQGVFHKKEKWYNVFNQDREWQVETYFSHFFSIALARDSHHYDRNMLKKVFSQNHVNASLFELVILITILSLGLFSDYALFKIPSGASILLLFTMILMIISIVYSWLKGWATTVFIVIIIIANFLSQKEYFNLTNYAYGLDYSKEQTYSNKAIDSLRNNKENSVQDFYHHLEILNNWRLRTSKLYDLKAGKKPKLVIINTSGGGLRSALWVYRSLTYANEQLNNTLLDQVHLISGSSGGMIGASYLREIYRQSQLDSTINVNDENYLKNISKDILNPLTFTLVVNDLFFRFQKFQVGDQTYIKDRGYAFEQQLNLNTNNVLRKNLAFYREDEFKANIPLMILNPTITNDGRRLFISSQPISFISSISPKTNVKNPFVTDGIEFSRFFAGHNPDSLFITTALRMSATFPYIMPSVALPTNPTIHLMDAGVRDNFGTLPALKYLFTFRNWINTNTDGVVIIQVRDKVKDFKVDKNAKNSLLNKLSTPLGSFYGNWEHIQNFDQDELILYSSQWFPGKLDVVTFQLESLGTDYISLSWHLTKKEKQSIFNSVNLEHNQESMNRLKELLQ